MNEVAAARGSRNSPHPGRRSSRSAALLGITGVQLEQALEERRRHLGSIRSVEDLRTWLEHLLQADLANGSQTGHQPGSLVVGRPRIEPVAAASARHLRDWETLLTQCLQRLQDAGGLRPEANASSISVAVLAALHGGSLLAEVSRDAAPIRAALEMALGHVSANMPSPPGR